MAELRRWVWFLGVVAHLGCSTQQVHDAGATDTGTDDAMHADAARVDATSDAPPPDAAPPDAPPPDAAPPDAAPPDAAPPDAAPPDAAPPDAAPAVVALSISPSRPILPYYVWTDLRATATLTDASTIDVTSLASWGLSSPLDAEFGAVGPNGKPVRGLNTGPLTITATYGGMTASADAVIRYWSKDQVAPDVGFVDFAGDRNGDAAAIWTQPVGATIGVAVSKITSGFATFEEVIWSDEDAAWWPKIAINPSGTMLAAWNRTVSWLPSYQGILGSGNVLGAGWMPAKTLHDAPSVTGQPHLAMAHVARGLVTWSEIDAEVPSFRNQFYSSFEPTTGWNMSPSFVQFDGFQGSSALDALGNGVVLTRTSSPWPDLVARVYSKDTGLFAATVLDAANEIGFHDIGVGSTGNALVVWAREDGDRIVRSASYDTSTGWSAPVDIANVGAAPVNWGQLATNWAGDGIVVWNGAFQGVYVAVFHPMVGWSPMSRLDMGAGCGAHGVASAVESNGNGVVAWVEECPAGWSVLARRYDRDYGWGNIQIIDASTVDVFDNLEIFPGVDGQAIALYVVDDGWTRDIWFADFD